MKTNRMISPLLLVICFWCIGFPAFAGDYDGSRLLLFSVVEVFECIPEGECAERLAESIGMPQFFKINFKNKIISAVSEKEDSRTTKILHINKSDQSIILQGVQNEKSWGMRISNETGKATLTISDEGTGFVIFGACMPM